MLKIFILLIITALSGCIQERSPALETLDSILISRLQSDSINDAYKACIFLGELALNKQQIQKIETILPKSTCKFYLLAKRVGNEDNILDFVENFPNSKKQKEIWGIHSNIGYPVRFIPPYIELLVSISINNNTALNKLTASLNHTDGAHAEAMVETLAKLYIKQSDRVLVSLNLNKIPESLISLIIETSMYFSKGMKNE